MKYLIILTLLLFVGCGLADIFTSTDPPDPAAVAELNEAKAKYEATVKALDALRAEVGAGGVTPEVIERLADQVKEVAEANADVRAAMDALRAQEDAGGNPSWLNLLIILAGQLGVDLAWRGMPSKGAGGAVRSAITGRSPPLTS